MVKVYFESTAHADLVAVFSDEGVYMKCLPVLEKLAGESHMSVTESVVDGDINDMDNDA